MRLRTSLPAALLLALVTALPAAAGERPLRMAVNHYFPPFSWSEGGELFGFDVDLANALCAAMDRPCKIRPVGYGDRIPGLMLKRFDVLVTPTTKGNSWVRAVGLTQAYGKTSSVFLAPDAFGTDLTKNTVAGKRIGIKRNAPHEAYLKREFADTVTIETFVSMGDVFEALEDGDVDLAFVPSFPAVKFLKGEDGKDFRIAGPPITEPPFGTTFHIAVRKEQPALLKALDAALATVIADGTHTKLLEKHFPPKIAATMRVGTD